MASMPAMAARISNVCPVSEMVCMLRIGNPTEMAALSKPARAAAMASVPVSLPDMSIWYGISFAWHAFSMSDEM